MGADKPLLCRLGRHHFVDFPDPNPETGGLEKQGYRACTRCPKEKDRPTYFSRSGQLRVASAGHPQRPLKERLDRRPRPTRRWGEPPAPAD